MESTNEPLEEIHFSFVVGGKSTAKTNICKRFCELQPTLVSHKKIFIHVWEIASQEEYIEVAPIYLRNCSFAMICFDTSDAQGFQKADLWINYIKSVKPNCQIAVAANKCHCSQNDVEMKQIKSYASSKGLPCYLVDGHSDDDIKNLFDQCVHNVYENYIKFQPPKQTVDLAKSKETKGNCFQ